MTPSMLWYGVGVEEAGASHLYGRNPWENSPRLHAQPPSVALSSQVKQIIAMLFAPEFWNGMDDSVVEGDESLDFP